MRKRHRHLVVVGMALGVSLAWWSLGKARSKGEQPAPAVATVAAVVAKQAKRTEKAEGKHDLVKDTVRTKTSATGKKVIEQVGEASIYRKAFHGKRTASGQRFNSQARTAAHPTLPLGTTAKVTNLETGKTVTVHITDRGPYSKGRNIDLSQAAAKVIGLTPQEGEAPVKIEASIPSLQ